MSSSSSEDSSPPSSGSSNSSKNSSPSTPPSSSSSPSPPNNSNSPSPPNNSNSPSPPSDSDSGNNSPPPSDNNSPPSGNNNSPPPSDNNSPPSGNNNSPPSSGNNSPPPSNNNSPPPSDNNSPPSNNNNSPPPNNSNNSPPNNHNNNNSPASNNNNKSPPPPSSNGNSPSHPSPPPPSSHGNSPGNHAISPPKSPPSSHKSPSGGSSNNEKAIIAGAAAGAALLLVLMIVCLVCCCKKKKKRRHNDVYFRDNSHANKGNGYYPGQQYPGQQYPGQWNPHPPSDVHLKMPPPPGSGVSSEHGWAAAPPPPPPPITSSSEMSSAAFSGPYQAPLPPPHPGIALGFNKSTFTYDDLAAATGGFARSNLLGQGGFGFVHKGVLPNGKEIAVKSLKSGSGQGEREFQAEVDIISRVHHRHLVSLVGYCIAGSQRMLVYEFVPNGTLEYHLYGEGRPVMDCSTRLRIALGSAKGFAYLHEDCHPRIIHRDIKAANILIDNQYEAKVADFGLAKLSSDNYTHVSTRIMGTFGYLAPEYASSGKLTEKSDVYSYGVVLLELISGKRPVDTSSDDDTLIDWARPILMQSSDGGGFEELVDKRLVDYDREEMHRMVACAAACIRHSARRRPKMSQIVRALEGDVSLDDLNEGVKPGHSAMFGSSGGSSEYDSHSYNGDMKRYRKPTMSSQDFTSGELVSSGESQEMHPRSQHSPCLAICRGARVTDN